MKFPFKPFYDVVYDFDENEWYASGVTFRSFKEAQKSFNKLKKTNPKVKIIKWEPQVVAATII